MLHLLRFTVRFTLVIVWVLLGLAILVGFYMWVERPTRDVLNRWWSRWMLRWCGLRVRVVGEPPPAGAALLVSNHVTWLDIYVLSSVRATIFIGKSELRSWPVLGWFIAGVGTLFIERGNRRAVPIVSAAMKERFDQGQLIGLFPEGTTGEGLDVLPFHAALFEPALRTGVAIQPVALRYFHKGHRSELAAYVGEQTLMGNAWKVLGSCGVSVEAVYLPTLRYDTAAPERHVVSSAVHDAIRRTVLSH